MIFTSNKPPVSEWKQQLECFPSAYCALHIPTKCHVSCYIPLTLKVGTCHIKFTRVFIIHDSWKILVKFWSILYKFG